MWTSIYSKKTSTWALPSEYETHQSCLNPCLRECEILNLYLWTRGLMQRASQRGRIWLAQWDLHILMPLLWMTLSIDQQESGARAHPPSPRVREGPAISSLGWHLLAFRRDVHLSSSLINNYSVCGPPYRPCILMTARAEPKRREKERELGNGVEWEEVE